MSNADSPANSGKEGTTVTSANSDVLVELHLYEYQALTNRVTYLVTLQSALWPLAFGGIAFVSSLWSMHSHAFVEWTGLLLGEILALAFYFTACEICTHVCYLETELKQKLAKITDDAAFWGWEPWLRSFHGGLHSGKGLRWWELWPSVCVATGVFAISAIQQSWTWGVAAAFAAAVVGFFLVLVLSIRLKKIQARYST